MHGIPGTPQNVASSAWWILAVVMFLCKEASNKHFFWCWWVYSLLPVSIIAKIFSQVSRYGFVQMKVPKKWLILKMTSLHFGNNLQENSVCSSFQKNGFRITIGSLLITISCSARIYDQIFSLLVKILFTLDFNIWVLQYPIYQSID